MLKQQLPKEETRVIVFTAKICRSEPSVNLTYPELIFLATHCKELRQLLIFFLVGTKWGRKSCYFSIYLFNQNSFKIYFLSRSFLLFYAINLGISCDAKRIFSRGWGLMAKFRHMNRMTNRFSIYNKS